MATHYKVTKEDIRAARARSSFPFRDLPRLFAGRDAVVCGLGPSLLSLPDPRRYATIGVNDVARLFVPDVLVFLDTPQMLGPDRWAIAEQTRADLVAYYLTPDFPLARRRTWVDMAPLFPRTRAPELRLDDPDSLPCHHESPFVAAALAHRLGAERIFLVGVDHSGQHFWPNGHPFVLRDRIPRLAMAWQMMSRALELRGCQVLSVSDPGPSTLVRGRIEQIRPRPSGESSLWVSSAADGAAQG